MTDWTQGFTSGVLGAVIGFGFTMAWDLWKGHHDERQRDRFVMNAVEEELARVCTTLALNQMQLRAELDALQNSRECVIMLRLLEFGAWELVKFSMPRRLARRTAALSRLRAVVSHVGLYNEFVRIREIDRLGSGDKENFAQKLRFHDEELVRKGELLQITIDEFVQMVAGKGSPAGR